MIALFCWFDWECWGRVIRDAINFVVNAIMTVIFTPIVDSIAAALGQILTTMATFWINVETPRPGVGAASGTIDWLQDKLLYFVFVAATISLIIAGMRMAWEHRGEALREVLKSLLTLVVVMGLATAVVGGLSIAGDRFSQCVINSSITPNLPDKPQPDQARLQPPPAGGDFTESSCAETAVTGRDFGRNVLLMLFAVTVQGAVSGSPMGIIMVITMGVLAIIASLIQVMMMIVRNGMLILLMGVLPLAAAATNTEMGKAWFRRCITWLTAFLLYKPVAALVYAAALRLASTDPLVPIEQATRPDADADAARAAYEAIASAITGFVMMILALFALPALMRFLTPLVSATAGANMMPAWVGGIGGWAASKMADSGAKGAGDSDGPTGARNAPQTSPSASGPSGSQGAQGATGATGAPGASGAAGSAGSAGTAGAAGGGAASTAASAGAGAATAGISIAVTEGAKALKKLGDETAKTVKDATDSASGNNESKGPSGSG